MKPFRIRQRICSVARTGSTSKGLSAVTTVGLNRDVDVELTGFDPTDPDLLAVRMPHAELLALRRTAPVRWIEQPNPDSRSGFNDTGFWALSKHADVAAVSKDQVNYSTYENGVIIRFAPGM